MQALIDGDHPIIRAYSDEPNQSAAINGFEQMACGGTHVQRTGKVRQIELKRKNPSKGKERIKIILRD